MLWSRHNDAMQIGEEAVRVAKATGAEREEGVALNPIGIAMVYTGEPERGLEYLRRSLAIAKESGDYDEASRGYINLGEALAQLGRTKEAIDVWLDGYERAHRAGLRFRIGGFLLCNVADLLYHSGDWAAMKTMLEEAARWMAPGLNKSFWVNLSGRLAMGIGDFTAARDCLEQAALQGRDGNPELAVESLRDLAELDLWEERLDESHDRILKALALTADNSEMRNNGSVLMIGLRAEAERAVAPGANDASRQAAVERAYRMIAVARRPEWDPMSPSEDARAGVAAVARAAATTCRAELSRLEGQSDTELWGEAASQWSACDRKYNEAYARWREAEALALAGRRRPAESALRRAVALASALGARPLKHEIEMLARRARLDLAPEVSVTEVAQGTSPAAGFGLTERELEVLEHLALGRTNREIAALLFISPKTASVHVSNIMRKLGVSNRIAAARAAQKAGLTKERPIPEPR
jgi:DNA-binding CsgD family transcriptional regulator